MPRFAESVRSSQAESNTKRKESAVDESVEFGDDTTSDHSLESGTLEAGPNSDGEDNPIDTDFEDKAVKCFRFFVFFVLVLAMATSGAVTWHFMAEDQSEDFAHEVSERHHKHTWKNIENIIPSSIFAF